MTRSNLTSRFLSENAAPQPPMSRVAERWMLMASKPVGVTYTLTKSAGIQLINNGFWIGGTPIDIATDRQPDGSFISNGAYPCTAINSTVLVEVAASGTGSDSWELTIMVDGQPLTDNPISEQATAGGWANHDAMHSF